MTNCCYQNFVPERGIFWYETSSNYIADTAIVSADSPDGMAYVGSNWHNRSEFYSASMITPNTGRSWYSHNGAEYSSNTYYVMNIAPGYRYEWKCGKNGQVPPNAVMVGRNMRDGNRYYVGKMWWDNHPSVGNIVPKDRIAYFPHFNKQKTNAYYEVLCVYPDGCCAQAEAQRNSFYRPQNACPDPAFKF